MITQKSDYRYCIPTCMRVSGSIIPARDVELGITNPTTAIVHGEDWAFLSEAFRERFETACSPYNLLPTIPYAEEMSTINGIRVLFTDGRFIDPSATITGGDGEFDATDYAMTAWSRDLKIIYASMSYREKFLMYAMRRGFGMRCAYYDLSRLTRAYVYATFTGSSTTTVSWSGSGSSIGGVDGTGGPLELISNMPSVLTTVSGQTVVDTTKLNGPGLAIISFTVVAEKPAGTVTYEKWIPVQLNTDQSLPTTGWTHADLVSWCASLGLDDTLGYRWYGSAAPIGVIFNFNFLTDFSNLGWTWNPNTAPDKPDNW